jgi:apolipoprotein N-acyltransferase
MPALILILKLIISFCAGVATVFAFAPFDIYHLSVLGPAVLLLLLLDSDPRLAFRLGFSYGLGLLGVGVFWMHISIDQFGGVGTLLAIIVTLAFIALMALYYGLMGWLGKRIAGAATWPVQLSLFSLLWVLLEWLRGWVLTGFPWLALGYSQIETALQGYAPLLGVYGVSLAVVISAACVVALIKSIKGSISALLVLCLVWGGGWLLSQKEWSVPSGDAIKVSIIQANFVQGLKWKPETRQPTIDLYRKLTNQEWDSDLIIWPETAIPDYTAARWSQTGP